MKASTFSLAGVRMATALLALLLMVMGGSMHDAYGQCTSPPNLATNNITSNSVNVSWNTVATAVAYEVIWSPQSGGSSSTQQTTQTSFFISSLQPGTAYDVRVRSVCPGGSNSTFSQLSFTTAAATCNPPTNFTATAATSTSVTLNWTEVAGATNYFISYAPVGNTNVSNQVASAPPFVLGGLTANMAYEFSIRANCGVQGLSAFTTITFDPNQGAVCNTPTGLQATNVTNSSATLSWNTVSGATSYDVTYKRSTDQNFTTLTTASPSVNISSLTANVTYEARVRAVCAVNTFSAFTAPINFQTTTGTGTCAAPTNFTAQGVSGTSASLSWTSVSGALNYEVTYRQVGTIPFTTITTNSTSVTLNNLTNGVTYEVRVRSFCGNDVFSSYTTSTLQTSGTSGECQTPAGLTAVTVTASSASLSWANVPNVNSYTVSYRRIGDANFTVVTATQNSTTLSGLTQGTAYEARVRANCTNGLTSAENGLTFNTQSQQFCPPASGLTVTVNNSTTALASWVGTPAAQGYEVSYNALGSSNIITFNVTNTSATLNGLSGGFSYQVRVRSICPGQIFSETISSTFSTELPSPCGAPTNFQSSNITTTNATFLWNQVTGANDYEVSYRRLIDANFITLTTNQQTLTIQNLTASTTYQVRVRARCSTFSDYATVTITTPSLPVSCASITNLVITGTTETSITVNWTTVQAAENYMVSYRISGQSNFTDLDAAAPPFTIQGLTGGATYDVLVRTRCAGSLLSNPTATQTTLPGGPCPAPANLAVNNIGTVTASLTWTTALNINTYEVGFRKVGDPSFTVRTVTGLSSGLTDLSPATNYEVRIRSACNGGNFSTPISSTFTTLQGSVVNCPTPNNLVATDIAPTSARLTWSTTSSFPRFEVSYRKASDLIFTTRVVEGTTTQITDITPNSNYEARVRNICADGEFSGFATTTFQTDATVGSCPPPVNLNATEVSFNNVKLVWQDGGAGQQYEVSYRKASESNFSNVATTVSPEFTITNLAQGTDYEARIRALCGGGFSTYVLVTFKTEGQAVNCVAPTNLTSVNVTDVSANLTWNNANAGIGMFFEVGYRRAGSNADYFTRTTSQMFLNITDLQPNTRYEWRVRTTCASNVLSAFANSEFTTQLEGFGCEAPTNLFMSNVLPTGIMVQWTSAAGVNTYEVGIRVADSGTDYNLFTTPLSMYSFGNLVPATRYEIRVRSLCANSSSRALVTVIQTLENITCDTPKDLVVTSISGEAALASWKAVPNVSTYNITYQRQGDGTSRTFIVGSNVTSYYLVGLIRNSNYTLTVRAICGTSTSLPALATFSTNDANFCFAPTRPQATDISETTARIVWDPSAAATYYELSFRRVGDLIFNGLTTNQTSHRLINLTSGTEYEIRLRSICGNGQSNWTSFNFKTANTSNPCLAPNVILVSKTSTVATLNWGPIQSSYELSVRPSGGIWNTTLQTSPPPYVMSNLTPGTTYEVRVRNLCEGRFSDHSNMISFTTEGNPCATPTISLQNRTSNSITIGLTQANTIYEVNYREVGAASYTRVLATNPNSYIIGGLLNGRTYEIQVRNFCGGAYSEYSNRIVTTASNVAPNCPVPTVQVNNVSARQATLFWNVSMTFYEVNIRNVSTNFTITSYNTTMGSLTLNNLTPNTIYEVTIRNICGGAFADPSEAVRFTTPFGKEELASTMTATASIEDLKVYPNPNNGSFTMTFDALQEGQYANVKIVDMNGRQVFELPIETKNGKNEVNINLEGFSTGIYLLHLSQGEMMKTMKVVLQ